MLIKGLVDEDFVNYKLPSMYIATATCSFKCDKEYGKPICQNSELAKQPNIDIPIEDLVNRYINNPITKAVVFGGLEPLDQIEDIALFIGTLRLCYSDSIGKYYGGCHDPVVIYTGYTEEEVGNLIRSVSTEYSGFSFENIIIKFGRYIPNQQPHYDPVLGVYLASDNQYAERIS